MGAKAHHADSAHQVDIDSLLEGAEVPRALWPHHAGGAAHPGTIEQDRGRAHGVYGLGHRGLGASATGNVHAKKLTAEFISHRLPLGRIAVKNSDARAIG